MDKEEIEQRVITAMAEVLAIDSTKVRLNSNIRDDFDASSLDLVQLVWTLEEEIGKEIPDDDIESFVTAGDIVDYVARLYGDSH